MNNAIKVNYTDKLTYQEWESIHKALKEEKKAEKRYYTKQKVIGGILVACSILCPVLLQDFIAPLFLLPLGIGVMVTKDKVI
jgi:hypothetical protein